MFERDFEKDMSEDMPSSYDLAMLLQQIEDDYYEVRQPEPSDFVDQPLFHAVTSWVYYAGLEDWIIQEAERIFMEGGEPFPYVELAYQRRFSDWVYLTDLVEQKIQEYRQHCTFQPMVPAEEIWKILPALEGTLGSLDVPTRWDRSDELIDTSSLHARVYELVEEWSNDPQIKG